MKLVILINLLLFANVAHSAIISVSLRSTIENTQGFGTLGAGILEDFDIVVNQTPSFLAGYELKGIEFVQNDLLGRSLAADFINNNELVLNGSDVYNGIDSMKIEIFDVVTDDGMFLTGLTLVGTTAVASVIANPVTQSVEYVVGGILNEAGDPVDGWVITYTGIDFLMNDAASTDLYTLEFSATPVPEPSSLLLVGLSSLVLMRRSRKCA